MASARSAYCRACAPSSASRRSEEHTSELQSRRHLVCRLLLEKKKAREDWTILRALSATLGQPLPFNTAAALHTKLFAVCPHLALLGQVLPADSTAIGQLASKG